MLSCLAASSIRYHQSTRMKLSKFGYKWKELEEISQEFELLVAKKSSMQGQYDEFLEKFNKMEENKKKIGKSIIEAAMLLKKEDNLPVFTIDMQAR